MQTYIVFLVKGLKEPIGEFGAMPLHRGPRWSKRSAAEARLTSSAVADRRLPRLGVLYCFIVFLSFCFLTFFPLSLSLSPRSFSKLFHAVLIKAAVLLSLSLVYYTYTRMHTRIHTDHAVGVPDLSAVADRKDSALMDAANVTTI